MTRVDEGAIHSVDVLSLMHSTMKEKTALTAVARRMEETDADPVEEIDEAAHASWEVSSGDDSIEERTALTFVMLILILQTRERCMLWGTSLAEVPFIEQRTAQTAVASRRGSLCSKRGSEAANRRGTLT